MITPLDIQNKKFGKGVRGYKDEEVDMFLDLITLDLEKVIKENETLKGEIAELEKELNRYQGAENEVVRVLEQAQQLMGDISISAEKRAEILLQNAEIDAELTLRAAKAKAERLRDENKDLEVRYARFRDKYKRMLEDELGRFENLSEDLFPAFDDETLEALVNEPLSRGEMDESEKTMVKETGLNLTEEKTLSKKTVILNAKEDGGL